RAFDASAGLAWRRAVRHETSVRVASIAITTTRTTSAYQVTRTCEPLVPATRSSARTEMKRLTMTRKPASPSADRCSAFPCPNWCVTSAGRADTRIAKYVSRAATRSVPECAASDRRPRLCVARPTVSFRTMSVAAAATETSAERRCGLRAGSEVAAERLLALDRLEERLEVPVAEAARTVPLDHLEEERRAVLRGLGEDLQQIAVVVTVGEDPQPLQVVPALVDVADAVGRLVVVRVGRREEHHAAALQCLDCLDDVRRLDRDVLRAGAVIELEVLLDLALALALGRLVDRELDLPLAVGHHLRHQRGVLGRDVFVAEVDHLRHPEDAFVELDPVLHPAELHVSDDVIERQQPDAAVAVPRCRACDVARQVRALVGMTVDERVHDIAVRRDGGELDGAELILDRLRLEHSARAALHRLPVGLLGVRHAQRDVLDAVAVHVREVADLVPAPQRARHDEANVVLLEDVARAVAHSRLGARVRGAAEAERVLVVVRGLLRVSDPELDVIPTVEGHEVVGHQGPV